MNKKILIVEDDVSLQEALIDTLSISKFKCIPVSSGEAAILALKKNRDICLVVSDVNMEGIGGMGLISFMKKNYHHIPFLIMTAFATVDKAVDAIKLGAVDYLSKPFSPQVLLDCVNRCISSGTRDNDVISEDPATIKLYNLAVRVAVSDASVLIEGPSGSGKEVLSRYIHNNSSRAKEPFVAINCAAIPENMLEATLFGYEKGAYTGAHQASPGKFEQAQGGTLLLDEISEMDINLQAKLLRVLQEREVERLGGRKIIKLDVRILATTNRPLSEYVKENKFRSDLYFRLNVFPIFLPKLIDRKKDILPLALYFIAKYDNRGITLTDCAKKSLVEYDWPGNIRELENTIQRSLVLANNNKYITERDILFKIEDCVY